MNKQKRFVAIIIALLVAMLACNAPRGRGQ